MMTTKKWVSKRQFDVDQSNNVISLALGTPEHIKDVLAVCPKVSLLLNFLRH